MTELNAQPAAVYRPGQVYTGADGDLLFVILPGDDIEFVTNRGTRITVAEVERVYTPLTLIGTEAERLAADLEQSRWCAKELEKQRDAHKTEAEQLRAEVERLSAELAKRCDMDDCEEYREWLSGEKADADKRARRAELERDLLADADGGRS